MPAFLDTVAADLYARYGARISELTLVFPNRRAHLFFSKSLAKIIAKPLWQPAYKSIEELIKEAAPEKTADTFTLLVTLYEVYNAVRHTSEPFDRFYYWGETLLHDFDQMDKYRVNAAALFTNLRRHKEMGSDFSFLTAEQVACIRRFWDTFVPEKESRLQQEFVEIWEVLGNIYEQFRHRLQARGLAYEGMQYRAVADRLADGTADSAFPHRYVFIGFNALNECEKTLFRFLQQRGQADFYWDYDDSYLRDEQQEAGLFLRENIRHFPSPIVPSAAPAPLAPVSVVAAPSDLAQAKAVPQLVKALCDRPDERTAVVLADEQLLIPLLHALPAVADQINITMGYPLRQTALYSLVELLLQLFDHAKTTAGQQPAYYYRDVQALLAHPYLRQILRNRNDKYGEQALPPHQACIPCSFFAGSYLEELLQPATRFTDLSARLLGLADRLNADPVLNEADPLLHGLLQHLVRQINRLTGALSQSAVDISLKLYHRLLRTIFREERIPFTGEPLAGIQVLGLLETRSLDFDNVVVLSANEGTLPRAARTVSFIPYNLRRGFGLPTPEQQDAVWAYYFYRLLQRAQRITLLYGTKTDGLQSGEASRYLLQLQLESGREVVHQTLSFDVALAAPSPITAPKTDALQAIATLSPSALNTYLTCPLRFHFRYVQHLKEPDEVLERVDSRLFGQLLHRSMELLYTPFVGQEITAAQLDALLQQPAAIARPVEQAIAREYYRTPELPPDFRDNGDLQIAHQILCRYTRQLLQADRQQAPFTLEGLELPVEQLIHFTAGGRPHRLLLGGIIDRLHRKGSTLYVVDYKTGRPDHEFDTIDGLLGSDPKQQHPAILQTLLYARMVQQHYAATAVVAPLLYYLRNSHRSETGFAVFDKRAKQPVTDIATYTAPLDRALEDTLAELFDPAQPFAQTSYPAACEHCTYRGICGRN